MTQATVKQAAVKQASVKQTPAKPASAPSAATAQASGARKPSKERPGPTGFLDAAAALFAASGYHGVSMRDIARRLGATPGAVYAHFPSKAGVLAAVYAEGVRRISDRVDAATAAETGPPWARLERAAQAHLTALLDPDSPYARVVIRVLPSDAPEATAETTALRRAYERRFGDLIAALPLAPGTDRRLLRLTLLGALNWTQNWWRPDPEEDGEAGATETTTTREPAEIARRVVAMLRLGVDAPPQDGETSQDCETSQDGETRREGETP